MEQFYMDTNVFISGLKPDDPYHAEGKTIVKALQQDGIRAETSVITLLEVASVSGRLYEAKKRGSARERKVFIVRTLRRLAGLRINFINIAGDAPVPITGIQASLPSVVSESILLSMLSSLRTLDLIHLAAARHAKRMNKELGVFVTGDSGFLANKKQLAEIAGVPIMSPRQYIEGLGLR